MEEELWTFFES